MGAQVRYTRGAWGDRNVEGVIEFPDDANDVLWSVGGGMRLNLALAKPWTLSGIIELNLTSVPEVVFCRSDMCSGRPSAG